MSKNRHEPHSSGDDRNRRAPAEPMPALSHDGTNQEAAGDLSRREFLHRTAAGGIAVAGGVAGLSSARGADAEPPRTYGSTTVAVTLQINGKKHELKLEPRVSLLDALRENLGLTGTKKGCDHG